MKETAAQIEGRAWQASRAKRSTVYPSWSGPGFDLEARTPLDADDAPTPLTSTDQGEGAG